MIYSIVTPFRTNRPLLDVMIDAETLGKRPGCSVLSIGAAVFDPRAPFTGAVQEISERNQFYAKILRESCTDIGLNEDEGTVKWWDDQSEEARNEAFGGTTHIRDAVQALYDWLWKLAPGGTEPLINVWSHGEDFDQPIITHIFELLEFTRPWPYNGGRDTRTVLDAADVPYKGVKHMALQDALDQTVAIERAFHELGRANGFQPLPVAA